MKLIGSRFLISLVLLIWVDCCAEFLYPVSWYTDEQGQQKLLVVYQKTVTHLQLWSWNPITHAATKILPAIFCPSGVAMLPTGNGFSFIDNGRIRIKEFIKRSARSVALQDTISNIGLITWHTNGLGYFHALDHRYYAIFSLTVTGESVCCINRLQRDCMYPSLVDTTLFYIERNTRGLNPEYAIFEQTINTKNAPSTMCVDLGNKPIIFLTMISGDEGFVVEHPRHLELNAPLITFVYHHLIRDHDNRWHTDVLFSFSIPSSLLETTNDRGLHESIIPLIPRIIGPTIYYVDYTDHMTGAVHSYNLDIHTHDSYRSVCHYPCVPVGTQRLLWYGGCLCPDDQTQKLALYLDESDTQCFSLPTISESHAETQ